MMLNESRQRLRMLKIEIKALEIKKFQFEQMANEGDLAVKSRYKEVLMDIYEAHCEINNLKRKIKGIKV